MKRDQASNVELYRRASGGDAAAWRALVRRHTPMVYRLSVRMLGPGAEAEDASQEAFLRMYRSFHTFDSSRRLEPWLGRITYNVCLRRLGGKARKVTDATDPQELSRLDDRREPNPERGAASREAGALVVDAMEKLSAQDRFLMTLRYREGLTDAEVSEATGMNVNTVKTRLHRSRKKLRKLLTSVFGGTS